MHNILLRQMRKHLGTDDISGLPADIREFISSVDRTYAHFDEDRELAQRSLEISSKELSEINTILKATFDAAVDGLLVTDQNKVIVLYNKRFVELWNIPEEIMRTREQAKTIDWAKSQLKSPELFVNRLHEITQQSENTMDILEFNDGRIYERVSTPLMIKGEVTGRVWSFRDVTTVKKSQEQLLARSAELEKINSLMIGRELKMVELKAEIKKLKQGSTQNSAKS